MVHRLAGTQDRKLAILAAVVALHAMLIALLMMQRSVDIAPEIRSTSIKMVSVSAERPAAVKPPPPPRLPAPIADTFVPVVELSIPAETESEAPAGASGACSPRDVVLNALLLEPVAVDAIRNAPPQMRSIADAIVIWNVGWNPVALTPVDPLFVVRDTIERSLSGLDDSCLDELVTGPRLFPIADAAGTRTTFLVIGSGNWTWRALLTPAVMPEAEGANNAAANPLVAP